MMEWNPASVGGTIGSIAQPSDADQGRDCIASRHELYRAVVE